MEHAWRLLLDQPKFRNLYCSQKPAKVIVDNTCDFVKRTRLNEDGQYSSGSGSNPATPTSISSGTQPIARPPGKAAMKKKGKSKAKVKDNEFGNEILQKISKLEESKAGTMKRINDLTAHDKEMMQL